MPTPTTLAIADETDLIVTVDRETILAALTVAAVQLEDVTTLDAAEAYGFASTDAAHVARRQMLAAVDAINESM